MGKRSNFERIPRDFYPTPYAAVPPLIPHLRGIRTFAEPCCGDGALVSHLESFGLRCVYQGDISTGQDALALDHYGNIDAVITNPPWTRKLLHPMINHFQKIAPTWLLIDQDWAATKQACHISGPALTSSRSGASRGLKGQKTAARITTRGIASMLAMLQARSFIRFARCPCHHAAACAHNAAGHIGHSVLTPKFVPTPVGSVPIANA
jgi:hypothetical protein